MKIFVDVGGFNGDTLLDALIYDYDRIHVFEPSGVHYPTLIDIAKHATKTEVFIHKCGLGSREETRKLYSSGSDGASFYSDKRQPAQTGRIDDIEVFPADEFFRNFDLDDIIHVKINVEGAEIQIMNNLIKSGQAEKIDELCIYYDAIKVPSLGWPMIDMMERKLDNAGLLPNRFAIKKQEVISNVKFEKPFVRNWLKSINKEK